MTLDEKLQNLPIQPGVYIHKNVKLINREFQMRACSDEVFEICKRAGRPCMEYQIKRCAGPGQKELCKPEQYRETGNDVVMLLEGKDKELADKLEAGMTQAAEEMRFEQAAKYRDLMRTVRALSENQKMMGDTELDVDIFGYHRDGTQLAL